MACSEVVLRALARAWDGSDWSYFSEVCCAFKGDEFKIHGCWMKTITLVQEDGHYDTDANMKTEAIFSKTQLSKL